jgi:hypothetical protein
MRQLRDRVPHALVDASGDVAAFDVRERAVQVRRRHRNGELLEAVPTDDDDIRGEHVEAVGEVERGQAGRLGHGNVVAALDHVEKRARDAELAGGDVVGNVAAVFVEQDRPAEHELELDVGVVAQLADEQLTSPVIGAAGDGKADPPFAVRNPSRGRRKQGRHTLLGS